MTTELAALNSMLADAYANGQFDVANWLEAQILSLREQQEQSQSRAQ